MDLIGERWSLFVMRELMTGPKRFSQLRAELPGISGNVLTQRLTALAAVGVVKRYRLPPPASAQVYALTDWGLEAEPILRELGRWASRSPTHDPTRPFSNASLVLSLRTMFASDRAAGRHLAIRLVLRDETYLATVEGGALTVTRDEGRAESAPMADATIVGTARGVAARLYNGVAPAEAGLTIEGDAAAADDFAALFVLPRKVAPGPEGV